MVMIGLFLSLSKKPIYLISFSGNVCIYKKSCTVQPHNYHGNLRSHGICCPQPSSGTSTILGRFVVMQSVRLGNDTSDLPVITNLQQCSRSSSINFDRSAISARQTKPARAPSFPALFWNPFLLLPRRGAIVCPFLGRKKNVLEFWVYQTLRGLMGAAPPPHGRLSLGPFYSVSVSVSRSRFSKNGVWRTVPFFFSPSPRLECNLRNWSLTLLPALLSARARLCGPGI